MDEQAAFLEQQVGVLRASRDFIEQAAANSLVQLNARIRQLEAENTELRFALEKHKTQDPENVRGNLNGAKPSREEAKAHG